MDTKRNYKEACALIRRNIFNEFDDDDWEREFHRFPREIRDAAMEQHWQAKRCFTGLTKAECMRVQDKLFQKRLRLVQRLAR